MTDAVKRGRNNRRKGGNYEREVAEALREVFPSAKRTIGQARTGAEAPDVQGTPFWVETGLGKTVTAEKKLQQADRDLTAYEGLEYRMPVAITRKPNGESIATMRLEDWLELVKQLYKP